MSPLLFAIVPIPPEDSYLAASVPILPPPEAPPLPMELLLWGVSAWWFHPIS